MPGEPDSPSAKPRLWMVLAGLGTIVLTIGLWASLSRGPTPSTTTLTAPGLTTSTATAATTTESVTTTGSTVPQASTTSLTAPSQTDYDIIVVGDGMAGATAASTAARLGADTLLLSPIGYFGGQAGAAGVSTMDEGGNRSVLRRSGIYKELVHYVQARYGSGNTGKCYFIEDPLCPEPLLVDEFFRSILANNSVDVASAEEISEVIQDGNTVTGLVAGAIEYQAQVVIDATEFSDLYPLVEGLEYEVGGDAGCVQDTTWLAIRSWYGVPPPEVVPPQSAMQDLYNLYGVEADRWLESFRGKVLADTGRLEGSGPGVVPWDISTETAYRALADSRRDLALRPDAPAITKTGVNYANDYPITIAAIEDPIAREQEFRRALHKTYAFLWYLRWELGLDEWGVASDMDFFKGTRLLQDDLIPDDLERHLPPIPYVREGRRLIATYNIGSADLADDVRGRHRFDDAVMLGGYFTDFHGCPDSDAGSGYGLFEVPIGVFIPAQVDGFIPGLARAAGVSRGASAAMRTQPEEMWGGQVAGILAGLAAINDIQPRQISVDRVQERLLQTDLVFFLP